jgi:4-hydroxy-tetrahydrodipicolinate reductase
MIKILLCGAAGKMGREIITAAADTRDISVVAGVEVNKHALINRSLTGIPITDSVAKYIKRCDCIVDFTTRKASLDNIKAAVTLGKPIVIGTTGFTDREFGRIRQMSKRIPILLAPNMSIGVNHLYRLVDQSVRSLDDFDIEIVETHHRAKKDAPSGTARAIASIVRKNRPGARLVYGRSGLTSGRPSREVCINAVRGGDIVGEHRVLFLGNGEFIELRHFATARACFAHGALAAVRFTVKKKRGLYSMADVLPS